MDVEYEREEGLARIYLNRPHRLNAMVPGLVEGLCRALDQAVEDGVRVAVLAGRGRAFCSGHDLKEEGEAFDDETVRRMVERTQDVTRKVRAAPFPVIAAVHGYALGGGCEFALCSDLVIAARNAVFGFPEVSVGLSVTGGISHILPLAVGLARAKQMVFMGEYFSAEQALAWGLVNLVVEPEQLDHEAGRFAKKLMEQPPHAMAVAKRLFDRGPQVDLETALELEVEGVFATRGSIEAKAAADRFRSRA
jgi:2-(1,2-epoxy-1,2-dihydrophenyl)acetyl-CoA isomerase